MKKPAKTARKASTAPKARKVTSPPALPHGVEHITPAGRSVFYDLFPEEEAAELEIRSELLMAIHTWLDASGLTQVAAAERLGVTQARISDLKRGKIDKFSIAQLIRLAARAGLQPRIRLTKAA
ncbi:MAG: helix-turn-helix domain-containing protein [Pseudomonadota bacterium]